MPVPLIYYIQYYTYASYRITDILYDTEFSETLGILGPTKILEMIKLTHFNQFYKHWACFWY